ncbi:VWA domain-containing protein [Pseudomonadales bacterium]|nr:VWA domain-containing protein [Pseudomonadales bacterium]
MSKDPNLPGKPSQAVSQFLDRVARTPIKSSAAGAGRLIFALDATASREPMWDSACRIQAEMFAETASLGGLQVQLCYYRGFQQFHCDSWCTDTTRLQEQMAQVRCLGGATQIGRVLEHCVVEARQHKVQALVFVGDAIEEATDPLCATAGQLGLLNVPVFIFQEGRSAQVTRVFQQIAQLSGGACVPFGHHSANELRDLLTAVAVYAAGGRKALENFSQRAGPGVALLTRQFKDQ